MIMNTAPTAPYAALLLRISLAILFFAHAGLKFFVYTPTGTAQFFESVGVPGWRDDGPRGAGEHAAPGPRRGLLRDPARRLCDRERC